MNHCLLEVEVLEAPQVRYTQDSQTPVAEMAVQIEGLRPDDPPGQLKVVGWGNLAQDLQNRVQVGQRLVLEGRLRMNTVTRQDGVKEKRAEFTLARLHPLTPGAAVPQAQSQSPAPAPQPAPRPAAGSTTPAPRRAPAPAASRPASVAPAEAAAPVWDTSPLVPLGDDDDIPF
ncbi:single-stranded DNA-binding protein [Cyanobium sp. Cruz CV13-4-11]|uniref:single-stranded DNA-binding protein n=1 Tax=unclassified Cyanobium TaxID=2627006 RepID=UPI0020CE377D|nr:MULTISPECIES: single-stranded DNA-binding protein [unclassified Cyanobium]MCP9899935.1 single-stranded DNA-binding protein [Cyanobium sp. Cruz CV11-17]MCP9918966.1 single-stranded DNA-binding protein [Cyanobium sp. Cruz CV13-4-11]